MAILDSAGRPIAAPARPRVAAPAGPRQRAGLLAGGYHVPWDAAGYSQEMAGWNPQLGSPDRDTTPYRDRIVARIRDIARNDGWASGAIQRIIDNVIGTGLRLVSKPDHRALARRYGRSFDATWAKEFADAADAGWRAWGNDPACWCDVSRSHTFDQLQRLAFRSSLVEGDALAALPWRPDRRSYGRSRYATTVQLIHADRLSNRMLAPDSLTMRGGVEIDADGVAVAYHIRQGHPGDYFLNAQAMVWERVPRETDWGRPSLVHYFQSEDIGQHRSAGGVFKAVLARFKMLARYDQTEIQAAIINAALAAYVESPFEGMALDVDQSGGSLGPYVDAQTALYGDKGIQINGARLPHLLPGEKISMLPTARPSANFEGFEAAVLRNISSVTGLSYEQMTGDYTRTTYSGYRGALLEAWKSMKRQRSDFAVGFTLPIRLAQMEEMFELGELPLPVGAPDFQEHRVEYGACSVIGPGSGFVDPAKEAAAAATRIEIGLSTLEKEAAETSGLDLEEILDQRQREIKMYQDRGLPLPASMIGSGLLAEALKTPPEKVAP